MVSSCWKPHTFAYIIKFRTTVCVWPSFVQRTLLLYIEGCLSAAQLLFDLVVDADFSFVHVFSRKFFSFFLFFQYVRFLIQK